MSQPIPWPYDESDGRRAVVAFDAPHEEWSLSAGTYYVGDEVWWVASTYDPPAFYRCILEHVPSAASEPYVGAQWQTYWENVAVANMPSRLPTQDQCILLPATDTAWVDEDNPDTTHPGSTEEFLRWRSPIYDWYTTHRTVYVKFDAVPVGYGGELELLVASDSTYFYVKNAVESPASWSGATLTWDNQPAWYDTYGSWPFVRPKAGLIIAGAGTSYGTRPMLPGAYHASSVFWSSIQLPSLPANGMILYHPGSHETFSHSYDNRLYRPVLRAWKP